MVDFVSLLHRYHVKNSGKSKQVQEKFSDILTSQRPSLRVRPSHAFLISDVRHHFINSTDLENCAKSQFMPDPDEYVFD